MVIRVRLPEVALRHYLRPSADWRVTGRVLTAPVRRATLIPAGLVLASSRDADLVELPVQVDPGDTARGLRPGDSVQLLAAYTDSARRGRAVVLLPAAEVVQVLQDPTGLAGGGQERGVQLRMPSDRARSWPRPSPPPESSSSRPRVRPPPGCHPRTNPGHLPRPLGSVRPHSRGRTAGADDTPRADHHPVRGRGRFRGSCPGPRAGPGPRARSSPRVLPGPRPPPIPAPSDAEPRTRPQPRPHARPRPRLARFEPGCAHEAARGDCGGGGGVGGGAGAGQPLNTT
jgi:hypothetical protein